MIDEDRTMQLYGYTSDELKPQSNKLVVRVCEECGGYKVVKKQAYRVLCNHCVHGTPEAKKLNSDVHIGYKHTPEACIKVSLSLIGNKRNLGVAHTDKARRKMSATRQGISYDKWEKFTDKSRPHIVPIHACTQMNDRFVGSEAHHLTKSIVIYIPSELHKHIKHVLKTGDNMGEMNMLAIQYLSGWW